MISLPKRGLMRRRRPAAKEFQIVPAWEAMLPVVRGEIPVTIHAEDVRQIRAAVGWATTNGVKMILADGLDAWRVADLLATNHVPVVFSHVFTRCRNGPRMITTRSFVRREVSEQGGGEGRVQRRRRLVGEESALHGGAGGGVWFTSGRSGEGHHALSGADRGCGGATGFN
jgi:hypothetical protein